MKIGQAGDNLSLARVMAAMLVCGIVLGLVGLVFDLAVSPLIGMGGWWTVFSSGGFILGGMIQATREFAVAGPAEETSWRAGPATADAAPGASASED